MAYVISWPFFLSSVEWNNVNQISFRVCFCLTVEVIQNKNFSFNTMDGRVAKLLEKDIKLGNGITLSYARFPHRTDPLYPTGRFLSVGVVFKRKE